MTEEEARKKWCPMTRNIQVVARSASGQQDYADYKSNCIASECMMWKWTTEPDAVARKNAEYNAGLKPVGDCGMKG